MKLLSFLDQIGQLPTAPTAARRVALAQLGTAAGRGLLGATLLSATVNTPTVAAPNDTTLDALTLLVQLEQLLLAFYTQALGAGTLVTAVQSAIEQLRTHKQQHLDFLTYTLTNAGVTTPAAPSFDFSGQHNNITAPVLFPNVFTDYASFLQLAQQLADASVRIYLGQLLNLTTQPLLFRAAHRMQATESRHAAHLRTLRRAQGTTVKSWPSADDVALSAPVSLQADGKTVTLYEEETLKKQLTAGPLVVPFDTILTTANNTAVASTAVAEAFDEPLTTAQAQALLALFS